MKKLRRKPRKVLALPIVKEKEGAITGLNITFGKKTDDDNSENKECQRTEAQDQTAIHDSKAENETTQKESEDVNDKNSISSHSLWYQDEKHQTDEENSDDRKAQVEFGLNVNNNNGDGGNSKEANDHHGSSDAVENNGNMTGCGSKDRDTYSRTASYPQWC